MNTTGTQYVMFLVLPQVLSSIKRASISLQIGVASYTDWASSGWTITYLVLISVGQWVAKCDQHALTLMRDELTLKNASACHSASHTIKTKPSATELWFHCLSDVTDLYSNFDEMRNVSEKSLLFPPNLLTQPSDPTLHVLGTKFWECTKEENAPKREGKSFENWCMLASNIVRMRLSATFWNIATVTSNIKQLIISVAHMCW